MKHTPKYNFYTCEDGQTKYVYQQWKDYNKGGNSRWRLLAKAVCKNMINNLKQTC